MISTIISPVSPQPKPPESSGGASSSGEAQGDRAQEEEEEEEVVDLGLALMDDPIIGVEKSHL